MKELINYVENNIVGRIANKVHDRRTYNLELLLLHVILAGDGNYIEIGSLFGGSAIPVALLKDKLGQSGFVFCIDPLDGYYKKYAPRDDMVDTQSGVAVTPNTLFENIKNFGVEGRIFVMCQYSTEVKIYENLKFSVAFIDGDHKGDVPTLDWLLVKDHVTDYVIFDNYDNTHPEVIKAGKKASDDPEWKEVYNHDITYVVQRIK